MHKPATGKEICSYNARQGASITASITHFLQPQQKYLDLLNWEQISCNPQAELKSIHVFYSINLANLFSCYFFYFSTVTFFPVTFFPTSPLLLSFLLLSFLLLFFLLLFLRYFFSCYFLSYNRLARTSHDHFIKWKHFPSYWPFVQRIHWSPVNSPQKGQWRRALICACINGSVNNHEAGDLGHHCAHFDVIVVHHQVRNWFGVQNGQKFDRVFQGKCFLWTMTTNCLTRRTWYSLKNSEDHFGYVWLPSHLYVGLIPNSSGQLKELFFYIIPLE